MMKEKHRKNIEGRFGLFARNFSFTKEAGGGEVGPKFGEGLLKFLQAPDMALGDEYIL